MSYKPFITKIPIVDNILNKKHNIIQNRFENLPLLNLGFHTYIHQNKNKMGDKKLLQSKFYLVTNKFEHIVNDYSDDLKKYSKKYFNFNKEKPNIISRAFFKLWEIIMYFDLIKSNNNYLSCHIAEGPGSFVQASMFFREMFFNKESKKDNYCAITLHSNEKSVPQFKKHFMECYSSGKKPKFILHTTYSEEDSLEDNHKDDGDVTNPKTINNFKTTINKTKKLADLVTADGGFVWKNENFQEQESYIMIFGEIITAINIQKKGGHFVLKIFETFTKLSLKYICILKSLYNEVYICKPLTSRPSNSEKYIVCKDFKLNDKEKTPIITKLIDVLEQMNKINQSNNFVSDIFSDYIISDELKKQITEMNTNLSNTQYMAINKIIIYKNGNNYFGKEYHNFKDEQINANKWWIDTFYPKKSSNLKDCLKNINKIM